MRLRWAARLYARTWGYFWLPCPVCGRKFGGHEWQKVNGHEETVPDGDQSGPGRLATGICPDCTAAGVGCLAHARAGNISHHSGCDVATWRLRSGR